MQYGWTYGTAVASIAAGDGTDSRGNIIRGSAYRAELIVVELKRVGDGNTGYTRTIDIMEGIDYTLRKAIELQKPIVINLSYGTNEGAHDGNTLFENYIADINGIWKNMIVIAAGNEGESRHHVRTIVKVWKIARTEFCNRRGIEKRYAAFIWKYFQDEFEIFLNTPSGKRINILESVSINSERENIDSVMVMPTPYNGKQLIEVQFRAGKNLNYVLPGIWGIEFEVSGKIKCGVVDMWLPTIEAIGLSTGFLRPSSSHNGNHSGDGI
ncbi:MAG: S8 family serine peptidase [Butyribacter sp.]